MTQFPIFTVEQFIHQEAGHDLLKVKNGHFDRVSKSADLKLKRTEYKSFKLYVDHTYYIDRELNLYTAGDLVVLIDYEYKGQNKKGEPIITLEGEEFNGYYEISKRVYGYWEPTIKEMLEPYMKDDFDPKKLRFLRWSANKNRRKYPIFQYGRQTIHGKSQLYARFPKTATELLDKIVPEYIERHEELLDNYHIRRVDKIYKLTINGIEQDYSSQRKVVDALKAGGESVSSGTRRKLFETLRD